MKSLMGIIAILAMLVYQGSVDTASAQQKAKITAKDLPAAVSAAFQKAYPHAKLLGASKETEKGVTYYEIESKDGTVRRDLLYKEDGTVSETEETIAVSALPKAVTASLRKELPHAKILKAETSTTSSGRNYEMIAKSQGKHYEISFDPSGKLLEKKVITHARKTEKEEEEEGEENEKD